MGRSKAEFRAMRDTVGMRQQDLAREMGVALRSVERWESPAYPGYRAPADAWAILDEAAEAQATAVASALEGAEGIVKGVGRPPREFVVPYWANQADYDEHHCEGDGGDWRQANANARLVAFALRERGIAVRFVGGDENMVPRG